jgi:glutamine synthetase
MGVSANGCHTNISLWKDDENVFLPDSDDVHMPSQIGLNAVGGILEHLRALTCVTASTVNSYRRFWETGFWAPVFADWGYQNRTTALRISSPDRFEYRSVDSAVNPYLAPEEGNIYEAIEAGKDVKRVPMTLGEALGELEQDEVVKGALPGEMYRVFMHYKRDEWERYCATVSDWDVQEYLDVLP